VDRGPWPDPIRGRATNLEKTMKLDNRSVTPRRANGAPIGTAASLRETLRESLQDEAEQLRGRLTNIEKTLRMLGDVQRIFG
jgi:hypothetical protein